MILSSGNKNRGHLQNNKKKKEQGDKKTRSGVY
jgi:hypothetical protein